jgi:hypothetical protein
MLSTLIFFNEPFTNIVTITFTALVITELLNVYSEVSYLYLTLFLIDQQAELEDVHRFGAHFRLLYCKYYLAAVILRYLVLDMALFLACACHNFTLMVAFAHS